MITVTRSEPVTRSSASLWLECITVKRFHYIVHDIVIKLLFEDKDQKQKRPISLFKQILGADCFFLGIAPGPNFQEIDSYGSENIYENGL